MIEINLLPEELRIKVKIRSPERVAEKVNIGSKQDQLFIYAIPVLVGLLVLVHLYFTAVIMVKDAKLVSLNRKWVQLEPQKKSLDEFNKEVSVISQDAGITQILTSRRVLWSQKLNELSLNLPSGVWFNEISINDKTMTIQGSVISLEKEEVSLINKLLVNLKADAEFSKNFSGFELSSVQKRSIETYDVADFILVGVLKSK